MTDIVCAHPDCAQLVPPGRKPNRPRVYCGRACRLSANKRSLAPIRFGGAEAAESVSWWLNTETFYAEARTRFPEAGQAGDTVRHKPILYAQDSRR